MRSSDLMCRFGVLGPVLLVIALAFTLALGACGDFDINPFDNETTVPTTTVSPSVSDVPGTTTFITTAPPPTTGAPLGAAAVDIFLHIEGVDGESVDEDHEGWIDVLSYEWGVENVPDSSIGRTGGNSQHLGLVVTKPLDKASPKLTLKCCKGEHIGEVVLSISKAGGDKPQIMNYTLEDVIITAVYHSGNAADEMRPTEQISLTYGKITWTYTELDSSGLPMGDVEANWNVEANKED